MQAGRGLTWAYHVDTIRSRISALSSHDRSVLSEILKNASSGLTDLHLSYGIRFVRGGGERVIVL